MRRSRQTIEASFTKGVPEMKFRIGITAALVTVVAFTLWMVLNVTDNQRAESTLTDERDWLWLLFEKPSLDCDMGQEIVRLIQLSTGFVQEEDKQFDQLDALEEMFTALGSCGQYDGKTLFGNVGDGSLFVEEIIIGANSITLENIGDSAQMCLDYANYLIAQDRFIDAERVLNALVSLINTLTEGYLVESTPLSIVLLTVHLNVINLYLDNPHLQRPTLPSSDILQARTDILAEFQLLRSQ
jgi:hypothetical protein